MRLGRLFDAGDARISVPLTITAGRVSFQDDKEGSGTDRLCQLLSFSALTMSVYPAQDESHIFDRPFVVLFCHGEQTVGGNVVD